MQIDGRVRWGILGAAEIARKNWKAIRNSGEGVVAGVASRDPARTRAFIEEYQAEAAFPVTPTAFESYEALIASRDIDAVYVPLPTALRKAWVIRAADAGKHVLCEKPCAITSSDLREMIAACARNRVQFMDGVMFMHSRRLQILRDVLDDPERVGALRRIAFGFSFAGGANFFAENIRTKGGLEPHGCLGDLGWYCIRFALWALRLRRPKAVRGTLLSSVGGSGSGSPVPTEFSAELFFEGGVSAAFYCSFITEMQQWVHLAGTKGSVRIPDFVLPHFGSELELEVSQPFYRMEKCDFNMEPNVRRVAVPEYSNSHPNAQESNLFRNFAKQIRSGSLNAGWPEWALATQEVMDACYTSALEGSRMVELPG